MFLSRLFFCGGLCFPAIGLCDALSLDDALRATYTACVGIDAELSELKKMAGINTAITGVGTGLGIGATTVGIIKSQRDKEIDAIVSELNSSGATEIKTAEQLYDVLANAFDETGLSSGHEMANSLRQEIARKERQSKQLGNWRTGLLAGNTVTNIAGAIIANQNRVDGDLQLQIDNCKMAVKNLSVSIGQAGVDGIDVLEAKSIYDACKEYDYVDISKINNRAKGATISSVVGGVSGLTGTVTSGVANSDSTRSQKDENGLRTDREKTLNTAANVLAGTSTIASATATVFNAAQIKAIKEVAVVAAKCTEVLK